MFNTGCDDRGILNNPRNSISIDHRWWYRPAVKSPPLLVQIRVHFSSVPGTQKAHPEGRNGAAMRPMDGCAPKRKPSACGLVKTAFYSVTNPIHAAVVAFVVAVTMRGRCQSRKEFRFPPVWGLCFQHCCLYRCNPTLFRTCRLHQ